MDKNEDHMNYSTGISSDWKFDASNLANSSMAMGIGKCDLAASSSCSSAPMADGFVPAIWDHPNSSPNLGFGDSSSGGIRWAPPNFLPNIPGVIPASLSQLPADSAFIERAARFSSFNGGNFSEMMNPFSIPETTGIYARNRSIEEAKQDESDGAEFSSGAGAGAGAGRDESECVGGESSGKELGSKKRKRNGKDSDLDQAKEDSELQPNGDQNPSPKTPAKNGKQGSQASEPAKEDYIHVRARRGQATNSHSLAERVRREKISERMKFLQDLVPGCSKVTGKAVMLDEIINYVQSLQRQVEFLSMKLATVNPRLDFNIEGLLTKDMLQSRVIGSSSSLTFAPDMTMAYPSMQQGLTQQGLQGIGGSSDALRRAINSHLTPLPGNFKETSQIANMWEDELNNVVQMSFGARASPSSQDVEGSLPAGHMKVEL